MASSVKIGVLGAGHLGTIHLKLIRETAGYDLVGFHDPDPEKTKKAENDLGLRSFVSAGELIAACDAVDIVTPTLSHFDCAVQSLRKSRHVFIEKPVTKTLDEARQLLALSSEANVIVQVGHVERFNPAFLAVKDHCSNSMFIEAHRLAEFNPRGTDVSVVFDLMIHDIDIVLSVVRSNIRNISASGVAVVSDSPDIANARIEFDNGCVANLTASRISMKNMRKCRFFRAAAYISVDFLARQAEILRIKDAGSEDDPYAMILDLGPEKGRKHILLEKPEIAEVNAIKAELEMFRDAIRTNTAPAVTMEDGYNAIEVATRITGKLKFTANDL